MDIRYINNKFYLGHDTPDYEVTENWLSKRKDRLWIHCKNLEAASKLGETDFVFLVTLPLSITNHGIVF